MRAKRKERLSAWLLACCTLILAAALILQCISIYRAGIAPENLDAGGVRIREMYSREIVSAHLSKIAWIFALWLAVLIFAAADRIAHKVRPTPPAADLDMKLERYRIRCAATAEMQRERFFRRRVSVIVGILLTACALGARSYLLRREHFTSWDLEGVMGAMMAHAFPWIGAAFAVLMVSAQICEKSKEREIRAAQDAPRREVLPPKPGKGWTGACRTVLLLVAVGLIAAGILNGGMYDVLVKAVNICTECIGLG